MTGCECNDSITLSVLSPSKLVVLRPIQRNADRKGMAGTACIAGLVISRERFRSTLQSYSDKVRVNGN